MDRDSLAALLGRGLSLEEIGRRFGRHPSTVSYWMHKYGLEAVNRDKHAAKGGIARERLEGLVQEGRTIAEIGAEVGLSKSAVRHWLGRYGLRTRNKVGPRIGEAARDGKAEGRLTIEYECLHHGLTEYVLEGRGYYRCKRCRSQGIAAHRRRVKQLIVEEAGGCCAICGYAASPAALEFHHLDPLEKRMGISANGLTVSLQSLREEVAKCVLLCSNCHAEVENGDRALPVQLFRQGGEDPK
jgi:transposase